MPRGIDMVASMCMYVHVWISVDKVTTHEYVRILTHGVDGDGASQACFMVIVEFMF